MPSSTRPMAHSWAAAAWTARFIAPAGRRSKPRAQRFAARNIRDGLPTGQAVITTAGQIGGQACDSHSGSGLWQRRRGQSRTVGGVLFQFIEFGGAHKLKTIAFPAISTGVYGYPMAEAAAVSSRTIEQFLSVDKSHRGS